MTLEARIAALEAATLALGVLEFERRGHPFHGNQSVSEGGGETAYATMVGGPPTKKREEQDRPVFGKKKTRRARGHGLGNAASTAAQSVGGASPPGTYEP